MNDNKPEQWRGFTIVYGSAFGSVTVKAKNGHGSTIYEAAGNSQEEARQKIRNVIDNRLEIGR